MGLLKIYLDNCCYNRPYDDQTQMKVSLETSAKLEIQRMIRNGDVLLVSSYILTYENNANRFSSKRIDIKEFISKYTHTYVSENYDVKVRLLAAEIMRTGIKRLDACHVACAVIAGCDYFLTTDSRLLKYRSENIKVENPVTFIMEMEERNEE